MESEEWPQGHNGAFLWRDQSVSLKDIYCYRKRASMFFDSVIIYCFIACSAMLDHTAEVT